MTSTNNDKGFAQNSNSLFSISGICVLRKCSKDLRKVLNRGTIGLINGVRKKEMW